MIDYKTLNDLVEELKRKNTSIDGKDFFERKIGKTKETFKTWRISIEKLTEDGYAKKLRGNNIIITPKGVDFTGYMLKQKEKLRKIFVSHAYIDSKIADKIVTILLINNLGIPKTDIFYTSKRDTGIPSRVAWRDHIRQEINDCDLFISLITPNYHASQMCQAELGAAWVLEKFIFSLYLPPITTQNFSTVIGERQADNLREKEEVKSFIIRLVDDYNTLYSIKLDDTKIEEGLKKFYRSLRAYLRKNAKDIGIDYGEESKTNKNNNPKDHIFLPTIDNEAIKTMAITEYPDDFSMQEYTINEQLESYKELESVVNKNMDRPEFREILDRAFREWKKNYSMVVYTVKEQLDSLSRMK